MRWLLCVSMVACHAAASPQMPQVPAATTAVAELDVAETETPPAILLLELAHDFAMPLVRSSSHLPLPHASDRRVWCGVTKVTQPWP